MDGGNSDLMIFPKEDNLHADSMVIGYALHIASMAQVTHMNVGHSYDQQIILLA
jgi:hypothetical protein